MNDIEGSETNSSEVNEYEFIYYRIIKFSVCYSDLWQELIIGCLQHTERDIQVNLNAVYKVVVRCGIR